MGSSSEHSCDGRRNRVNQQNELCICRRPIHQIVISTSLRLQKDEWILFKSVFLRKSFTAFSLPGHMRFCDLSADDLSVCSSSRDLSGLTCRNHVLVIFDLTASSWHLMEQDFQIDIDEHLTQVIRDRIDIQQYQGCELDEWA